MTVGAPIKLADAGARFLSSLDPERAHRMTVRAMASGFGPVAPLRIKKAATLAVNVAGLPFANPLGLAAGFDKNGEVVAPMLRAGFGFVEAGAVTPRPQAGNAAPRVFRLREDRAIINRYGFNNDGAERIARRLARSRRRAARLGVVGLNLGANKNSADRIADYVDGLQAFDGLVDFFTVNISSPNTPGLRALQGRDALMTLLMRVMTAKAGLSAPAPVFLKIAPDLTDTDKADIAECVRNSCVDGLIVSNTTITRANLTGAAAGEAGGLSGAPLFEMSTRLLAEFAREFSGSVPLIGVGGVASGRQAYEKILRGASLVQLYTGLVYEGPGLITAILKDLIAMSASDGYSSIADATGAAL